MIELDLTRGPFLLPVLVRAVRTGGVQAGFDLDRLAAVSAAVESVARSWAGGGSDDPLRVTIEPAGRSLAVHFHMPEGDAARCAEALNMGAVGTMPGIAAAVVPTGAGSPGLRITAG